MYVWVCMYGHTYIYTHTTVYVLGSHTYTINCVVETPQLLCLRRSSLGLSLTTDPDRLPLLYQDVWSVIGSSESRTGTGPD